jgi:hypothetical protein
MYRVTARIDALEATVRAYRTVLVAFSGGVDSTLVAHVANRTLGAAALIVLARTETIADEDVELAREIAARQRFNYLEIAYRELDVPNYAANPIDRCYYCRDASSNGWRRSPPSVRSTRSSTARTWTTSATIAPAGGRLGNMACDRRLPRPVSPKWT